MKKIFLIFFALLLCQCSVQIYSTEWEVIRVKSNYVQKGILDTDYYLPPKYLVGKKLYLIDSLVVLSDINKNFPNSALNEDFGDTLIIEKSIIFKKREDDEPSILFPGSEVVECLENDEDTCVIGRTFFSLLEIEDNVVSAYISSSGKNSKTRCILFILKKNRELVLYCENDFLLLFLLRK